MKEHDHVIETGAIEVLQLIADPGELNRVAGDVRIECDEESVSEPEGVRRIAAQPAPRPFRRNQPGVRRQRVVQAKGTAGIARGHAGDIVVACGKEVRDVRAESEFLDDRSEAHVPHRAILAPDDGVAGLQHEADRKRRRRVFVNPGDHPIDDSAMLRVRNLTIAGNIGGPGIPRIAVRDEGKPRDTGGRGFRRQWRRRGLDRTHRNPGRDRGHLRGLLRREDQTKRDGRAR